MSDKRFQPGVTVSWFVVFVALSSACGDSAIDGASDDSGAGSAVGGDAGASSGSLDGSASGILSGTFTLDEYGDFLSPDFFGVIEVDADPPAIRRLYDGSKPVRVSNGGVLYRRPCGQRVTQIMLADESLRSEPLTPCSSNVPVFDTTSAVEFVQSALSEDGSTLAVEATYYEPTIDGYPVATVVFDVASQTVVAQWTGGYAPVWMPSGRLLLASNEGLMAARREPRQPDASRGYHRSSQQSRGESRRNRDRVRVQSANLGHEHRRNGCDRAHHRRGPAPLPRLVSGWTPGDRVPREHRR